MSVPKLVVFDCDGVMFDSKEANREYYNDILARFDHSPMNDDELDYVHTHHVADSVRYIYRNYPGDYEKAEAYRLGLDYTPYLKFMRMEPDLITFLEFLTPKSHRAISTNRSTTMNDVLRIFKLGKYFEKVVTALDVKHSKPHPEALYAILSHFNVEAQESIYIGDSVIDLEHSSAVGMPMIAFRQPQLKAAFHVSSFMEIARMTMFQ